MTREDLDPAVLNNVGYDDRDPSQRQPHAFTRRPYDHIAALLHQLLTPQECRGMIATATAVMETTATQYEQYDRQSDRALLHAPELAAELYARVLPLLRREDYQGRIPLCFGHDGVWAPHSINPVLKVVRYREGGHFADHRDGPWIPREDQATLFTLVIYLNDDFDGGTTVLIGERTEGHRTGGGGFDVKPTIGMGLLFNHDLLHGAQPVANGTKYILRAEVIFERVTTGVASLMGRYAYLRNEAYVAASRLYHESSAACEAGDRAAFMAKYQLVVDEQRKAAEASLLSMLGDGDQAHESVLVPRGISGRVRGLSDAEFSEALLFLTDREVVTLMATSRRLFMAIATSSMWRQRCIGRFGEQLPASLHAASSSAVAEHLPWVSIYQQQVLFGRRFAPCVLWPTPSGARFASLSNAPQNTRCGSIENRLYGASRHVKAMYFERRRMAGHGWRHCIFPDVYGGLKYSTPLHMNFPAAERYTVGYSGDPRSLVQHARPVCRDATTGWMEWSVLVACVDACVDAVWTPVIVVDFPTVTAAQRTAWRRAAARDLFEIYRFPAIRCASVREVATVRWAAERGAPSLDALPPFDLVLCLGNGSGPDATALFVLFAASHGNDDALIVTTTTTGQPAVPAYEAASTTIFIEVAPRTGFDTQPSLAVAKVADWMKVWQQQVHGTVDLPSAAAPDNTSGGGAIEVRDWCWLMEGAACLGMRPEFRSECIFRHGAAVAS